MTNLSIKPSILEVQIKPNTNYTQSYIVKNNGTEAVTLNSSVDSWIPQGSNGNIVYLNSPPNLNISLSNSDLKLGQNFILNPNQSRQLVLKIQGNTSGDHYFTFFINQDTSAIGSSNSTQLIRLGSHLLISISDSEIPITKFKINNFKVNNPFIDSFFSTVKFSGQFVNQSDYYSKIDNSITISKNNNNINKLTLFPDNVLSHHTRNFRCLEDNLPIACQLQRPLWPGFYQAKINNQAVSFFIFPYSLLIFLSICVIITKVLIDINQEA